MSFPFNSTEGPQEAVEKVTDPLVGSILETEDGRQWVVEHGDVFRPLVGSKYDVETQEKLDEVAPAVPEPPTEAMLAKEVELRETDNIEITATDNEGIIPGQMDVDEVLADVIEGDTEVPE